jgi:hypothetical protein
MSDQNELPSQAQAPFQNELPSQAPFQNELPSQSTQPPNEEKKVRLDASAKRFMEQSQKVRDKMNQRQKMQDTVSETLKQIESKLLAATKIGSGYETQMKIMEKSRMNVLPNILYNKLETHFQDMSAPLMLSMFPDVIPDSTLSALMKGNDWEEKKEYKSRGEMIQKIMEVAGEMMASNVEDESGTILQAFSHMVSVVTDHIEKTTQEDVKFLKTSDNHKVSLDEYNNMVAFFKTFNGRELINLMNDVVPDTHVHNAMMNKPFF